MDPENVSVDYRNITLQNLHLYHKNFSTFPKGVGGQPGKLERLIDVVTKYRYNCYLLVGPAALIFNGSIGNIKTRKL
jgi:hypothetical protein